MAGFACPCCGEELVVRVAAALKSAPVIEITRAVDVMSLRNRFGLNEREVQVADLFIRALSHAEIASRVGVKSAQVAKNTMQRVYRKVGVNSRAELLIVAKFGKAGLEREGDKS